MKRDYREFLRVLVILTMLFQGAKGGHRIDLENDAIEDKSVHSQAFGSKRKQNGDRLFHDALQAGNEVMYRTKKNGIPNEHLSLPSGQPEIGPYRKNSLSSVSSTGKVGIIKRGFLANLATLLNDADSFTIPKNESGMSSMYENTEKTSLMRKSADIQPNSNQNDRIPSMSQVEKALNATENEYAPIFAYFRGKIVPLGKLPNTSFKKSHSELTQQAVSSSHSVTQERSMIKEITGQPRHEIPEIKHVKPSSNIDNDGLFGVDKASNGDMGSENKISKLQQYLTNLDGHVPDTGITKDVRGVAKDEVVFPQETEHPSQKNEIIDHVKGFVLDDGKVVSLTAKPSDLPQDKEKPKPITTVNTLEKFYVANDGNLYPLTKSKSTNVDAVTRDTTISSDGINEPKTVAVSLDMLKELLKKTDTKISLAQLLNKGSSTGDSKSDVAAEEDPGTIEDFAAGGLKSHNEYRKKHHDSDLKWSDDLASKAQKLAESLADKKQLEIAKDLEKEGYGENVAKVWATFKDAGEAAAKMWYTQSENYRFDDPHLDENTGQFAQMVWKNTKEIGMGVAKSIDDVNNKYVYVVALYRPPGNIEAQLRDNVLPTGNNTVDVYTTFFKRSQALNTGEIMDQSKYTRRSKLLNTHRLNIVKNAVNCTTNQKC